MIDCVQWPGQTNCRVWVLLRGQTFLEIDIRWTHPINYIFGKVSNWTWKMLLEMEHKQNREEEESARLLPPQLWNCNLLHLQSVTYSQHICCHNRSTPCIFELQKRSTAIKHEWAAAANSHWGFKHTNKSVLRGKLRCGIMYAGMYSSRSSYKTRLLWGKSGINYSSFYMWRIERIKGPFSFPSEPPPVGTSIVKAVNTQTREAIVSRAAARKWARMLVQQLFSCL